jgi:hypothetical protein
LRASAAAWSRSITALARSAGSSLGRAAWLPGHRTRGGLGGRDGSGRVGRC